MSVHLRPRTSLRRMPVMAVSHRIGKNRCPAAVRRNARSSSSVHAVPSTRWSDPLLRGSGDEGDVAGDEPRRCGVGERAADDEVDLVHGLAVRGRRPSRGWSSLS